MGNEKTLFSFGCSEEFCETLREWLFQTDFLVEGYTNYKRVWADLSRRTPEVVFINVDIKDGLQLLTSLRGEVKSSITHRSFFWSRSFSIILYDVFRAWLIIMYNVH